MFDEKKEFFLSCKTFSFLALMPKEKKYNSFLANHSLMFSFLWAYNKASVFSSIWFVLRPILSCDFLVLLKRTINMISNIIRMTVNEPVIREMFWKMDVFL